jgi:hypothetical protein
VSYARHPTVALIFKDTNARNIPQEVCDGDSGFLVTNRDASGSRIPKHARPILYSAGCAGPRMKGHVRGPSLLKPLATFPRYSYYTTATGAEF